MGVEFGIDLNGLDEDLKTCITNYPDEVEKFLRKESRAWRKQCNDKGYGKYTNGKRPIAKSWKTELLKNGLYQSYEADIKNSSPLFHLLENGHVKWIMGRNTGGFVQGKHYAEQTREQFRQPYVEDVEAMCKRLLGRSHLV